MRGECRDERVAMLQFWSEELDPLHDGATVPKPKIGTRHFR